jgi:hypothetical protein
MRRPRIALATAAVLVCLPLAGCGDDDSSSGGTPAGQAGNAAAASADTGAAKLRATLAGLLVDHVYATAAVVTETLRTAGDAGAVQAATEAADENARALARVIGSAYGPEAGTRFLGLWREHVRFFVDYAKGKAARDEATVQQALADLDAYRGRFGDELARMNPKLKSGKIAADLQTHVETMVVAINAIVAGTPGATGKLAEAGAHMPMTAGILAIGTVAAKADRYPGAADAGGAVLRSGLTALLRTDAHLTLRRAALVLDNAEATPAVRAAARALAANAVTVGASLSSVYGEDAGDGFLKLWRAQARAFAAYAAAKRTAEPGPAAAALDDLDAATSAIARLLGDLGPQLRGAAVTRALDAHVAAVTAAIRADAANSPKRYARELDAAAAGGELATVLARAITRQFPDSFPAT